MTRVVCAGRCHGRDRSTDVSASIGVTILKPLPRRDPSRFRDQADRALYGAKAAGRNPIRVFGEDPTAGPADMDVERRTAVG